MDSIAILERLVAFDTTSHHSNLDLIEWVREFLQKHGIPSRKIFNKDGTKSNLIAKIGPDSDDGIILSGHTDVVPVSGQTWSSDPFKLTRKGKKLYGRGACDMKGFLACVLAAVPAMAKADLSRPFYIAFSYDEEVGALGVQSLVDEIGPASAAIIGEPTELKVADHHKGCRQETVVFKGVPAHSSLPQLGVSAIEHASSFIDRTRYIIGSKKRLTNGRKLSDINVSTINFGTITGGTASNIIAEHCEVEWQLRGAPIDDAKSIVHQVHDELGRIEDDMKSENPLCHVATSLNCDVPQLRSLENCFARDLCQNLTGENTAIGVNFGTEAGFFQRAGIPSVVCGPGSIEQAHKADEFIKVSEMKRYDQFMNDLIKRFSH